MSGFKKASRPKWMLVNGVTRENLTWAGLTCIALLLAACSQSTESVQVESDRSPMVAITRPDISAATPVDVPTIVVPESESTPLSDAELIAMGERIYSTNCAPCHQPNGEGNLSIFPALNRNPFVTVSDPRAVIGTVLHGRQVMPAFEPALSAQEVAAVISYTRNAWNNQAPVVSAAQVREIQEQERSQ